ncbi:zeta toxin family protein [Micromonospora olivasterospora]|uniref:UDP-N-acetylglucosamine kinase n=2 Tax=Micromonospora olivasterospora TaxID=1880 RepID=A0A562HV80_MICOL|nr:zeta toxin family protein [Micromonospora olivasterospora]TWH62325.1 zeta toxin [Micromonospora olivasterospora]
MTDHHDGVLSEEANERIFREQIVPMFLTGAPTREHPVLVIVGGQTGAGKTAVTAMVKRALGASSGFININMDFYNPMHPSFHRWQAEDETTASAKVRPDGERWWDKAQQYAIDNRCHVVLESAMRYPSEFEDIARRFHNAGYRVEVAIVAVPEALSRLGILHRYWEEVQEVGRGRLIDTAIHDECYRGVIRGAQAVDTQALAHAAFAFRRSGEVVYANAVTADGTWQRPAALAAAITAEHHRPWPPGEQAWYLNNSQQLRAAIDPRWHATLAAIDAAAAPLMTRATSPVAQVTALAIHGSTRRALQPRTESPAIPRPSPAADRTAHHQQPTAER